MSKEITIAKHVFTVSQPYAAGHVVTEAEAKALNQVRAENIRNNMASKVAIAYGDAPTEEITAETIGQIVADYDAAYVFTLASVGGGRKPTDPVETEALRMARQTLTDALRKKGTTLKAVTEASGKDKIDAKIAEIAAREDIRKAAKKAVEQRNKQADDILGDLGLSDEPADE